MRTTMPTVRRMSTATTQQRGSGAPAGNRNAALPNGHAREAFVSIRCRKSEKTAWVRAANAAQRAGQLDGVKKSALATWVITTLSAAAAETLRRR